MSRTARPHTGARSSARRLHQRKIADPDAAPPELPEVDSRTDLANLVADVAGDDGPFRVVDDDGVAAVDPALADADLPFDRVQRQRRHLVDDDADGGCSGRREDLAAPYEEADEQ